MSAIEAAAAAVTQALAAMETATEVFADREARVLATSAELASLRERAGAEALDGGEDAVERIAAQQTALESRQLVEMRASDEASKRRAQAQLAVRDAYAAQWHAKAEVLDAQAAERQQHTDALLAELAEFEGVPFEPRSSRGLDGAGVPVAPYTKTQQLRQQAKALRVRAGNLVQAPVESLPAMLAAAAG